MLTAGLRILLIVFNQVGYGTYWRAYAFGRSLAARGHAVTLLATSPRSRFQMTENQVEGLQLVQSPDLLSGALRSGWDLWNSARRMDWIAGRAFDVVHAFETRPTVLFPALAARRHGAKLIMDWCDWFGRGGSVEERSNPLVRFILRPVETFFEERFRARADATTVINRCLQQKAETLGVKPHSILLLRNGTNVTGPVLDCLSARQAVDLPGKGHIIGYVGGIFERDAVLMAQSLERVRRTYPEVKLLLIGYFNRDIEALLKDSTPIVRTGPIAFEKLNDFLAACDVCWLPLRDSGANRGRWPLKLSDYMAAGRPVVATDVGDLAEVVLGHGLGVIARDHPDDFASATTALLADAPRRQSLGQAARRAAEEVFNWDRMTDDLERHYWSAMKGDLA